MADFNISELYELFKEFGISDLKELRRRVSDDGRASAAWHDGYQQGFKYAHTMQSTMDQCSQALRKIEDFNNRHAAAIKALRAVEKKLKALDD